MIFSEHEKLKKVQDKSQTIGEFLEWLRNAQNVELCRWGKPHASMKYHGLRYGLTETFYEVGKTTEQWLAEYFGIDQAKLEQEKQAMLDEMRRMNAEVKAR